MMGGVPNIIVSGKLVLYRFVALQLDITQMYAMLWYSDCSICLKISDFVNRANFHQASLIILLEF